MTTENDNQSYTFRFKLVYTGLTRSVEVCVPVFTLFTWAQFMDQTQSARQQIINNDNLEYDIVVSGQPDSERAPALNQNFPPLTQGLSYHNNNNHSLSFYIRPKNQSFVYYLRENCPNEGLLHSLSVSDTYELFLHGRVEGAQADTGDDEPPIAEPEMEPTCQNMNINTNKFNVDGTTVSGASGGAAAGAGFTVSAGGTTVLAFSFTGATIADDCGLLTSLALAGEATGLSGLVFSDSAAATIDVEYCTDCVEGGGDGCTSGVYDCTGVCDGSAVVDECGVCDGDGSSCIEFTKNNGADPSLLENQDCIVDNICLTRGNSGALYNAYLYNNYNEMLNAYDNGDNALIKWAEGTVEQAQNGELAFWNGLTNEAGNFGQLVQLPDRNIVAYLVDHDIYLNFNFLSWTSGQQGGGFSYIRDVPSISEY